MTDQNLNKWALFPYYLPGHVKYIWASWPIVFSHKWQKILGPPYPSFLSNSSSLVSCREFKLAQISIHRISSINFCEYIKNQNLDSISYTTRNNSKV